MMSGPANKNTKVDRSAKAVELSSIYHQILQHDDDEYWLPVDSKQYCSLSNMKVTVSTKDPITKAYTLIQPESYN